MIASRRQFMALGASSFLAPGVLLAGAGELDTAYINARVWTGVHGAPIAKALGIKGSRIAAVDEAAVKAKTGKRTRVVDLEGAFVVPGFVDGHVHFLLAALDDEVLVRWMRDFNSPAAVVPPAAEDT